MFDGSSSCKRGASTYKVRSRATLRPITRGDIASIACWPAYRDGYEQMDYALREGGWLAEYGEKPGVWRLMAEADRESLGFSLLIGAGGKDAEFRIALHPEKTGQGFGEEITLKTLELGFYRLGFDTIHLIVRKNNSPAIGLYKKIGFRTLGECNRTIQGKSIEFFRMDMNKQQFENR